MTEYEDGLIEQVPDGPRTITRKEMLIRTAAIAPVPVLLAAGIGVTDRLGGGSAHAAEAAEAGLLEATPECDDGDSPTPSQTEGPYFTPGSPERSNLVEPGMPGTLLKVTGVVYTRNCVPVANTLMDWWQCDDRGVYDNSGYRLRGHLYTDSAGKFTLQTIVPGLYPGRTRHIHVKVQAPSRPILTTQLYFPNEPGNNNDSLYDPRLLMVMSNDGSTRVGTFDVVLNYTTTPPTTTTTAPPAGRIFENTNDVRIPDRGSAESPISVTGITGTAPAALAVAVAIKHTYRGDLIIDLVSPAGTRFRLKNASNDAGDDVNATYTVNASSQTANGTWRLRVTDAYSADTGYIDSWSLRF